MSFSGALLENKIRNVLKYPWAHIEHSGLPFDCAFVSKRIFLQQQYQQRHTGHSAADEGISLGNVFAQNRSHGGGVRTVIVTRLEYLYKCRSNDLSHVEKRKQ